MVWLFSLVLGYSRYVFARIVRRQDLPTVVRCHLEAFAELGGVPREVLYDRMKTVVLGEDDDGQPAAALPTSSAPSIPRPGRGSSRQGKHGILIHVEPEMARRLKHLAVAHDTSLQALGVEAFTRLLAGK